MFEPSVLLEAPQQLPTRSSHFDKSNIWEHVSALPPTPPDEEISFSADVEQCNHDLRPVTPEDAKLIAVVGVG